MPIEVTVYGCGGAGGKAAINLFEKGIVDKSHVKLFNTTTKDVPEKYSSDSTLFFKFGNSIGGCGKESSKGRAAMIECIQSGQLDFGSLINDDAKEIILVGSVGGGSSSGSVPVLAKYFESLDIPVHVFAFIGFQDEARELNNTLKFFKDLPSNTILHTIMNSYFLDYTKNYSIAEQAANDEFAREVEILIGSHLQDSKQVIDETDLYKINTQPGYMTINHIPLTGVKNMEGFNEVVARAFDNSCYLDCDLSAKRIAVIINATKKVQRAIDNSFEVIKRYVGVPIETFQHIQPDDDSDVEEEYIDVICCGMNYPERGIKDISIAYNKLKDKLNTSRKSFADIFSTIETEDDDLNEFNVNVKSKINAGKVSADLFDNPTNNTPKAEHKVEETVKPEKILVNPSLKEVTNEKKASNGKFISTEKTNQQTDKLYHSGNYTKQSIPTINLTGDKEIVEMDVDVEMEDPENPISTY